MRKKCLRKHQMSDVAYVQQAASWAEDLLGWESRGPGDTDNAMRRLSRKTGVSYATYWKLRYRRPKDLGVSVFFKLQAAYEAVRQHQIKRLTDETKTTAALAGPDRASVRAAQALVDAAHVQDAPR